MNNERRVSVIGLGYVGLPVAMEFGKKRYVVGFDIDQKRVEELQKSYDHTGEVEQEAFKNSTVHFTSNPHDLREANFHIVAVPTPIDAARQPDFKPLAGASRLIGEHLKKGDIIVYESTVYPGATEERCVPILEQYSGLTFGRDFFVGYSPERINPGDKEHTFTTIKKIVAGCDENTLNIVAEMYGEVVKAGVHKARCIKTAEAAKVIENTQRDLNIALMNELSIIFHRIGIDTQDVLDAAGTKWNFLKFKPGLVGGHCIGVDPYYLTFKAKQLGYRPEVILAGRRINDQMGKYIVEQTIKEMIKAGSHIKGAKVAVLGFTFKENVPDIRNSRVVDIVHELETYSVEVLVHDPIASKAHTFEEYGIHLVSMDEIKDVDAIIVAVGHTQFLSLTPDELKACYRTGNVLIDVKSIFNQQQFSSFGITVWRL